MQIKEGLVRQLAGYQAEMFDREFDFIGNLYLQPPARYPWDSTSTHKHDHYLNLYPNPTPYPNGNDTSFPATAKSVGPHRALALDRPSGPNPQIDDFRPGPILSPQQLGPTPIESPHGPYSRTSDWLGERLDRCIEKYLKVLPGAMGGADRGDLKEYSDSLQFAFGLLKLLPTLFPTSDVESTQIFHHDLHKSNILIGPNGIVGVLDWEYVSVVPVWYACQLPRLLDGGRDREEPPDRRNYPPWDSDDLKEDSPYWGDLFQHERMLLKQTFLEEMSRIRPSWIEEYKRGTSKRDFVKAIGYVEEGYVGDWREWLENLKKGKVREIMSVEGYQRWLMEDLEDLE